MFKKNTIKNYFDLVTFNLDLQILWIKSDFEVIDLSSNIIDTMGFFWYIIN